MLVLTRKVGEKVYLDTAGGRIEVVIVEIDRNKVRLGFVAAPEVIILRDDLKPRPPAPAKT